MHYTNTNITTDYSNYVRVYQTWYCKYPVDANEAQRSKNTIQLQLVYYTAQWEERRRPLYCDTLFTVTMLTSLMQATEFSHECRSSYLIVDLKIQYMQPREHLKTRE